MRRNLTKKPLQGKMKTISDFLKELLFFIFSSMVAGIVGIVIFVFRILKFGTSAESGFNAIFAACLLSSMIAIVIHNKISQYSKGD